MKGAFIKRGSYFNEEVDDKAIFGSILIIAAGVGLIFGALLPWAHFITDGEGWLYGFDVAGKYTALIALPLIIAGVYRFKSPESAGGIVAIILGVLASVIGISRLIEPRLIVGHYASFKLGFGLYLTVFAGVTGLIGGVFTVLGKAKRWSPPL